MVKLSEFIKKIASLRPKKLRCPRIVLSWQSVLLVAAVLAIPMFGYVLWRINTTVPTLDDLFKKFPTKMGGEVSAEIRSAPALAFGKEGDVYTVTDDDSTGIRVEYPNKPKGDEQNQIDTQKDALKLSFPKDYSKPLEVDLGQGKKFTLTDQGAAKGYRSELLDSSVPGKQDSLLETFTRKRVEEMRDRSKHDTSPVQDVLSYRSPDGRKTILYSYRNDGASGAKKLKNWTIFAKGNGTEEERYSLDGATARINDVGDLDIFLKSEQDMKNEAAKAQVDPGLLERAKRTLEKENGAGAMNGNRPADLTIPKPYYVDKDGSHHGADWVVSDDGKAFSVSISDAAGLYPIALDPTLSFTAPGQGNSGDVITGNAAGNSFGYSMVSGDFNADGRADIAISSPGFNPGGAADTGRVYVFYSDGLYSSMASGADVSITGGAAGDRFGETLAVGDFNSDGKTDLAVGASAYSSYAGRAYIFYNDGSIPTTAATADVIITGEASSYFGTSLAAGDFNADGGTDLVVGAVGYSSFAGRAYIFYGGGSISTTADSADIIISGESSFNVFSSSLISGDWNADGKTDLAVGAYTYSSSTGRAYIFYNDGSIPTTAASADVVITGEASSAFGFSLISGDWNADGKTDLAVGASAYSSYAGRAYIFYNDGSIPTTAATADVIITGEASSYFGTSLASGDFNADGKTDLAIGASGYSTNTGRSYIFYSDSFAAKVITQTYATSGTQSWTAPAGVTTATVRLWGGGGGGAGSSSLYNTGGGAGGQFAQKVVSVTPGNDYTVVVAATAAGGASGGNNGTTGNDSTFNGTTVVAKGGAGGQRVLGGGGGGDGSTSGGVGDTVYRGGNGGDGVAFVSCGSGGGGAGTTGNGGDGSNETAGTGTSLYGGTGGAGRTTSGTGNPGNNYGAGGGGGGGATPGNYAGGSGAQGYAEIEYVQPLFASSADVIVTGESSSRFGSHILSGDFNADGKTDFAVGSDNYATDTGRVYVFYSQNGIVHTNASISGTTTNQALGSRMATADFNQDGRSDLVVGDINGHTYIFYNDGSSFPSTVAGADVTIANGYSDASSIATGDFNADGKPDIAIGESFTAIGRVALLYNDGSWPTGTDSADATIDNSTYGDWFGNALVVGDFNADGRDDIASSAIGYNAGAGTGRVYVFFQSTTWPSSVSSADAILTGTTAEDEFGTSTAAGDFNADGKTDLAVGAPGAYTAGKDGHAYVFYNGSITTKGASSASIVLTGNAGEKFGSSVAMGDFNSDGEEDLAVGAGYEGGGYVHIFYSLGSSNPSTWAASAADVSISDLGTYHEPRLLAGDFNADGRTDLVATNLTYGAYYFSRTAVFYNDGSYPSSATEADVVIDSGEMIGNGFYETSLAAGDFNDDGRDDFVIGEPGLGANGVGQINFYIARENFAWQTHVSGGSGSMNVASAAGQEVRIVGEQVEGSGFGFEMTSGDFNADGKTDLAVSTPYYNTVDWPSIGRVYLFYNDGSVPTSASSADAVITGTEYFSYFGWSLASGDMNSDGRTDLVVGTLGMTHVFYNDGTYPDQQENADLTITSGGSGFGSGVVTGDFNTDGRMDLAVYDATYNNYAGEVDVFYNDGSWPTTQSGRDAAITGQNETNMFGGAMEVGDFNADGKTDLLVSSSWYSSVEHEGRVYIFHGGSITTESASGADTIIEGSDIGGYFGSALVVGDFNADGRTDFSTNNGCDGLGCVFIIHNDGSYPGYSDDADVRIVGSDYDAGFGMPLAAGDFNGDGRTDLAASTNDASVHIFFNDGSYPATEASSDMVIPNVMFWAGFGPGLGVGDFNADGRDDLVISNPAATINGVADAGSVGIYTFNDAALTGDSGSKFGYAMTAGDFNADGKTDLAVSASEYSSSTGRVYLFYNDGSLVSDLAISSADSVMTGGATGDLFGTALAVGDFNADGKKDIAVSAEGYSAGAGPGRTYLFYQNTAGGFNASIAASAANSIITEDQYEGLGRCIGVGDFNTDGKTDLAVGVIGGTYGHVRIFYQNSSGGFNSSINGSTANSVITGEADSYFGTALQVGDFNSDGKSDIVATATAYSSYTGRVYMFYQNTGGGFNASISAASANVLITGEMDASYFGGGGGASQGGLAVSDFNVDGKVDLAVGAHGYNTYEGRAYIFYQNSGGGFSVTSASSANVIIASGASFFGLRLASGDLNADGGMDLIVGTYDYNRTRTFIFYNDGAWPLSSDAADVVINGSSSEGQSEAPSYVTGDFNADGKGDLAIGADNYNSDAGHVSIVLTDAQTVENQPAARTRGTVKVRGDLRVR